MWRQARRIAALAYWNLSEAVLWSLGRRQPYGVLRLELTGDLAEQPLEYQLLGLPQRARQDYFDLVAQLRWAREDPQLRAVLVRCGELHAGWSKIQEIRRGLTALRAAGKTVWVHLTHAGIREYVLASAAHQIVLAPSGTLDITGLSSEVTFVAGTLKKLGIQAQLVQMGKFKAAAEAFTRSTMSKPHREMVESLLQDLYGQVVDAIADGRRMDPEVVRTLLDRGPFVGPEAAEARLADVLLYEDEAEERLRAACDNAPVIEMQNYVSRRGRAMRREGLRRRRPSIALLQLTGTLKTGESIPGPEGASACGAASVRRDLQELRDRHDVGAVVVRISSPGGSGLASDLIWHEIVRTRRAKPVVVSLGDVAASGGYYVGVAGSPLIAEGGTITGSIGVLAGKAVLRGLYDRLGVTKQVVTRGRHAGLYSDYLPLGEEERERLRAHAEVFYSDFLDKVANGRLISHEAAEAAAAGRVWTGRQAHSLGLVDQLGGLERALDQAKVLAGLTADELVVVERFPKPRRLWRVALNLSSTHGQLVGLPPWLRFLARERIWALLPFQFRFF